MPHAPVHTDDRRVLTADNATRNYLLSTDLVVKLSDFNQSTILPLDADIETAGDSGYSIYTVATGQACEFDLFNDLPYEPTGAIWLRRKDRTSTESRLVIIERCWAKASFRNTCELLAALNSRRRR